MKLIAPQPGTRIDLAHDYTTKALLTPSEARFHTILEEMTQGRCRILIKPRLADVFQHDKTDISAFNRISSRHVDFLICQKDDWTPMLGIELDDDSHQRAERKERDMFVNSLFASTCVPLLRIDVREVSRLENLVKLLSDAWHQRCATLELV